MKRKVKAWRIHSKDIRREDKLPGWRLERMKKYRFTAETVTYRGHVLHRVIATEDFGHIKAGTLGGFIESGYNLSRDGTAWVGGNAYVFAGGRVIGDAQVYGGAMVMDDSQVGGTARVCDRAIVACGSIVTGNSRVWSRASVYASTVFGGAILARDVELWHCNIGGVEVLTSGTWRNITKPEVANVHL